MKNTFFIINLSGFKESDDSDEVILEPKLIAKEYIHTWFFLDLLSSIPVDYIFLILDSGILKTDLVIQYPLALKKAIRLNIIGFRVTILLARISSVS